MEADLKTLRLANVPPSPESLERFVRFQRAYTEARERGITAPEAHQAAVGQSGASPAEIAWIRALCADFAGKRSTLARLRRRRAEAAAKGEAGLVERLETELGRLDDLGAFAERYGHDTVALLRSREDELVDLHQRLARCV